MKNKKDVILKTIDALLLVGVLAVIVYQLYLTFQIHQSTIAAPQAYIEANYKKDFISNYGERFVEIKNLFEKPTKIAYVGEEGEGQSAFWTHYFLTQYYLAPNIIVKNNTPCDTVLYNLYDSKLLNTTSNFHINNGYHIVKDFNNGLIVLAK